MVIMEKKLINNGSLKIFLTKTLIHLNVHNFLSFNLTFLFWIYMPKNFILKARQQLFNKVLPRAKVSDAVKFA